MIEQKVTVREIANVLEEEAEANRAEFQERYAYAQMVSRQYPQLATSRRGVKKLFDLGDTLRGEYLKKTAIRALECILGSRVGDVEEINKFRTLVKGDKAISLNQQFNTNAYMPDTSIFSFLGVEPASDETLYAREHNVASEQDSNSLAHWSTKTI